MTKLKTMEFLGTLSNMLKMLIHWAWWV